MKVALDTNVLVRLLVADNRSQTNRAKTLVDENSILIATSVILEAEWVLRSAYKLKPEEIRQAFLCLFGLQQVTLTHPERIHMALKGYKAGLDFADALHLASSCDAQCFATLDRKLVKGSKKVREAIDVIEP